MHCFNLYDVGIAVTFNISFFIFTDSILRLNNKEIGIAGIDLVFKVIVRSTCFCMVSSIQLNGMGIVNQICALFQISC